MLQKQKIEEGGTCGSEASGEWLMSTVTRMKRSASFLFLTTMVTSVRSQGQDDRCLLQTGGSTLTFFPSEDLEIGGLIGKVDVVGE